MRHVQNILLSRSICSSQYAERGPATGRAVSARLTTCNTHQARACQRRPAAKTKKPDPLRGPTTRISLNCRHAECPAVCPGGLLIDVTLT